jgi:transcriptional regulator with PAS, ATPase and Fis domain
MSNNRYLSGIGADQDHHPILQDEAESVKRSLKREFGLSKILGISRVIQDVQRRLDRISSCDVNVLILGESGTGKELAARTIHYLSHRAGKPFIPVNCGAIPENLFENELFGHVRGAFTDAGSRQIGIVKEAEGGTIFLDEISVISAYLQVKLLRLIQEKEYKPLGDPRPRKTDIRIIVATNRDLQKLLGEGTFREDLFYRLNIVSIVLPPLRERKEDIPILTDYFIKKYSEEFNQPLRELPGNLMAAFMSYPWPGNVRELENKIQQLILMPDDTEIVIKNMEALHFVPENREFLLEAFKDAKKTFIDSFERDYLTRLLSKHKGNVAKAAVAAGKSRTSLWNLMRKYDFSSKPFR